MTTRWKHFECSILSMVSNVDAESMILMNKFLLSEMVGKESQIVYMQ